jgi:hypothetical protein
LQQSFLDTSICECLLLVCRVTLLPIPEVLPTDKKHRLNSFIISETGSSLCSVSVPGSCASLGVQFSIYDLGLGKGDLNTTKFWIQCNSGKSTCFGRMKVIGKT